MMILIPIFANVNFFVAPLKNVMTIDHLNLSSVQPLPSPQDLHNALPITVTQKNFVNKTRTTIQQILDGKDNRLLLIMGPCSIHDITAAKEYATLLRNLMPNIGDLFQVIMRVYFEKPRTSLGWKGMLNDPFLNGTHDIATGLHWTRQLLQDLADMEIPTAAEFLDPSSAHYFGDLISWGCIGARTTASQTHRQMASALPMPVAFKNSTDGNVDIAINGAIAASMPHTFIGPDFTGRISTLKTRGNSYGHIVLRGSKGKPNYDPDSINRTIKKMQRAQLPLRLLIDCSHDNSFRTAERQNTVFQSVVHQIVEGNRNIRGFLLESNIFDGKQFLGNDPSALKYAVSLTDPCLGWASTERLIRWGYDTIKREYANQTYQTHFAPVMPQPCELHTQ
jgi:3-deoxy-7-phosphoheptulonate synthase